MELEIKVRESEGGCLIVVSQKIHGKGERRVFLPEPKAIVKPHKVSPE